MLWVESADMTASVRDGDQCDGAEVADDGVILDGRVTVGHDASPRPWRSS
jgi:hypothetical protein